MVKGGHQPHFISYYPGEHVQVTGVQNYFYDYFTMHRFRRLVSLQTAWHLRRLLQHIQPDILHTGWVQDHGFFGALCGFHPVLSMPWGSDILIRPYDSTFSKWITRFTIKRADMVTCDCEVVKKEIIQLAGYPAEKIMVFPWGIDLNIFKPFQGESKVKRQLGWEDKQILIMNRSFKPVYGIEYFLAGLPMVNAHRPETRVILVGDGILRADYEAKVASLGLKDKVYFTGFVDDRRMAEYLQAADIYVTTSLSDGTSCSMLEAMACGLPVVVSDTPAYFEWVEDGVNGYIVPRCDSLMLAEQLVHLLGDANLRHEMGQRNLGIAKDRADWEKNFDQLQGIYYALINNGMDG
jgi:glycosyltransferase involved in cell wall biosynthesis